MIVFITENTCRSVASSARSLHPVRIPPAPWVDDRCYIRKPPTNAVQLTMAAYTVRPLSPHYCHVDPSVDT